MRFNLRIKTRRALVTSAPENIIYRPLVWPGRPRRQHSGQIAHFPLDMDFGGVAIFSQQQLRAGTLVLFYAIDK